jgi:hypothetical protein
MTQTDFGKSSSTAKNGNFHPSSVTTGRWRNSRSVSWHLASSAADTLISTMFGGVSKSRPAPVSNVIARPATGRQRAAMTIKRFVAVPFQQERQRLKALKVSPFLNDDTKIS